VKWVHRVRAIVKEDNGDFLRVRAHRRKGRTKKKGPTQNALSINRKSSLGAEWEVSQRFDYHYQKKAHKKPGYYDARPETITWERGDSSDGNKSNTGKDHRNDQRRKDL